MRHVTEHAETAPGHRIALILLGIAITPLLLSSSSLGNQLSSRELIQVTALGALILTLLSMVTIAIGAKARIPTYGIVKYAFGTQGAIAINMLMAISMFGWIAVTANMFGHTLQDLLARFDLHVALPWLVAGGCLLFMAATAFGFKALGRVAQIAVPVIALMLCYILRLALQSPAQLAPDVALAEMSFGVAVSTVVGTAMVLVTTLPDFGSLAHDRKQALIAALLAFALAYPLLYWAGAMPSALSRQGSLLAAMTLFGALLPAALLMLFATVSANAGNLFQGTLVVSTLLPSRSKWHITLSLGLLASLVGSLDIMSWFIPFLLFLGVATPPVAGIYVGVYWLYRRQGYDPERLEREPKVKRQGFAAWILGSLFGGLTIQGALSLTGIPSLDSLLISAVVFVLLTRCRSRREGGATS